MFSTPERWGENAGSTTTQAVIGDYRADLELEGKMVATARAYLFFFSCFSFRFSLGVRWAFFCCSRLPLSLLPLSPIAVTPQLNTNGPLRGQRAYLSTCPLQHASNGLILPQGAFERRICFMHCCILSKDFLLSLKQFLEPIGFCHFGGFDG